MTYWVSNCGGDEHGRAMGGEAGDQTRREYRVKEWTDFGQDKIARHPDPEIGNLIARLAVQAADNDNIGYDQSERLTMWQQLQKVGYWPKDITRPCEADCSSSTAAIVKAVGYLVGDEKMQRCHEYMTTWTETAFLSSAGFQIHYGFKEPKDLLPGDIQFNTDRHTNIYIGTDREGPEPIKKRRKSMECIIGIKGRNTLVWFDGVNINDLTNTSDLGVVQKVAKATIGEELPRLDLSEEEFARFCQSLRGGYPKHLKSLVEKYPSRSPEA